MTVLLCYLTTVWMLRWTCLSWSSGENVWCQHWLT